MVFGAEQTGPEFRVLQKRRYYLSRDALYYDEFAYRYSADGSPAGIDKKLGVKV